MRTTSPDSSTTFSSRSTKIFPSRPPSPAPEWLLDEKLTELHLKPPCTVLSTTLCRHLTFLEVVNQLAPLAIERWIENHLGPTPVTVATSNKDEPIKTPTKATSSDFEIATSSSLDPFSSLDNSSKHHQLEPLDNVSRNKSKVGAHFENPRL